MKILFISNFFTFYQGIYTDILFVFFDFIEIYFVVQLMNNFCKVQRGMEKFIILFLKYIDVYLVTYIYYLNSIFIVVF